MTHDDSADDSLSKIIDLENGSKNANPDISEIVTDLEFVFKSKVLWIITYDRKQILGQN